MNYSYASNYFDEGLKNLSVEIKSGIKSGYNFNNFKQYLIEFVSLENLSSVDFLNRLKKFKVNYDDSDFLTYKLNRIILEERMIFTDQNFIFHYKSFVNLHGKPINIDLLNESFITLYLQKHIEVLIKKICEMTHSLDKIDSTTPEIIDVDVIASDSINSASSLNSINTNAQPLEVKSPISFEILSFDLENFDFPNDFPNDFFTFAEESDENLLNKKNLNDIQQGFRSYKKKYECTFEGCNKVFDMRSKLRKHEAVHSNERDFVCDYSGCDSRYKRKNELIVHYSTHL